MRQNVQSRKDHALVSQASWRVEGCVFTLFAYSLRVLCLTEAGWIAPRLLHRAQCGCPDITGRMQEGNLGSSGTAAGTDTHRVGMMSDT